MITSRESLGTAVAYYRNIEQAEQRAVTAGEGEPVRRLRIAYRDKAWAEFAELAELRRAPALNERCPTPYPAVPNWQPSAWRPCTAFAKAWTGNG
jgi:hypothetical protein